VSVAVAGAETVTETVAEAGTGTVTGVVTEPRTRSCASEEGRRL
jgi:hypothetical protein